MKIDFPVTQVFSDVWEALNETYTDEKGKLRRKYRIIEEVGGSRSSKTWSNFQVFFLYAYKKPMANVTIMRDTKADCRDKVEGDWERWITDPCGRMQEYSDGIITDSQLDNYLAAENLRQYFDYNKTLHLWTFKHNNSKISFTGSDDEDRVIGKGQSALWVNEPYKFSEGVFNQLLQRTDDFAILDWNPRMGHWIEDLRNRPDTFSHRSNLTMNPFCPVEQRKHILGYQPLKYADVVMQKLITLDALYSYDFTENPLCFTKKQIKEAQRCLFNEAQKTADEYNYKVFMLGEKAEKPNRIFKWKPCTVKEYMELNVPEYYGVDWGQVDPFAIIGVKYYDGCLYCHEYNYSSENEIRANLTPEINLQLNQSDEGLIGWLFDKLGLNKDAYYICDTNRPLKIGALRQSGYSYAIGVPKGRIVEGIDILLSLNVFYTESSENIEIEQENYSRQVDRYKVVLEEAEDTFNHTIDAIKYVAFYLKAQRIITKI